MFYMIVSRYATLLSYMRPVNLWSHGRLMPRISSGVSWNHEQQISRSIRLEKSCQRLENSLFGERVLESHQWPPRTPPKA